MAVIGVGTHIVECLRIARMIERHGELFVARVFTEHEVAYCAARQAATQHYAGAWAAKEAVLQAIGFGGARGLAWRDIEVRRRSVGPASVRFHGAARDAVERLGVERVHLAISHCHTHATAYSLVEG